MLNGNTYPTMRRRSTDGLLLREYVRSVLTEDDVGSEYGSYADAAAMSSPYGVSFGSAGEYYKTFLKPWVDVFKTAEGKTKETARKAVTVLQVGARVIISTVIPIISFRYKEVFDAEKRDVEKIRSEYKSVYDSTASALTSGDAGLLAFMAAPEYMMAGIVASKGPEFAINVLSSVTGGVFDELLGNVVRKLDDANRWADRAVSSLRRDARSDSYSYSASGGRSRRRTRRGPTNRDLRDLEDSYYRSGALVNEEKDAESAGKKYDFETLLKNKKFLMKGLKSKTTEQMKSDARRVIDDTLKAAVQQAQFVMKNVKSLDDFKKIAKKSDAKAAIDKMIASAPPDKQKEAEQATLKSVRSTAKEIFLKPLRDRVAAVKKDGVPDDSYFIVKYKEAIQTIEAM